MKLLFPIGMIIMLIAALSTTNPEKQVRWGATKHDRTITSSVK